VSGLANITLRAIGFTLLASREKILARIELSSELVLDETFVSCSAHDVLSSPWR
jgi:hypothetical protein